MNRTICFFILMALFFMQMGCDEKNSSIERISMDFPHGETRLLVQKNGDAFLFYGALPQSQKVKNSVFNIDELYTQLQPRLHDNVPREKWPNPNSKSGMVTITFDNNEQRDYLIFDEEEFADRLFNKAKNNIVGKRP